MQESDCLMGQWEPSLVSCGTVSCWELGDAPDMWKLGSRSYLGELGDLCELSKQTQVRHAVSKGAEQLVFPASCVLSFWLLLDCGIPVAL